MQSKPELQQSNALKIKVHQNWAS